MIKPKPMKRCRTPAYPTRMEVARDPRLLDDNVPAAWRQRRDVVGTLGVFLAASLVSCDKRPPGAEGQGPQNAVHQPVPAPKDNGKALPQLPKAPTRNGPLETAAAVVAPIFEHGEGRGAAGCIVVAPPVFLSEEEALQVITEELAKNGVEPSGKGLVIKDVTTVQRKEEYRKILWWSRHRIVEVPGTRKPLETDLYDASRRIAVEFVSVQDSFELGDIQSQSTVQVTDCIGSARLLSKKVEAKGKGVYFGAFYDPLTTDDWLERQQAGGKQQTREEAEAQASAESKDLLRQQVKDFVAWLKAKGAL